jgi:hypothetical protein
VPLSVVSGLFRYEPRITGTITDLVAEGWLVRSAHAIAATARSLAVLYAFMSAAGTALIDLWGWPEDELARVDAVVRQAVGTSTGPVFDSLATVDADGAPALRLFERCTALRHHRADAHATAWRAVGLTATSVGAVASTDPVRREVETATNRIAARAYRPLSTVDRAGLVALLRRLPG